MFKLSKIGYAVRSAWGLANSPISMLFKPMPVNEKSDAEPLGDEGFEDSGDGYTSPPKKSAAQRLQDINSKAFFRTPSDFIHSGDNGQPQAVMDFIGNNSAKFSISSSNVSPVMLEWYAANGFIGYQTCSIIAQHWLVNRACSLPGKDAIRNGFELTSNSGDELKPEVMQDIRDLDKEFRLNKNLKEFSKMRRVFGIRIMLFLVTSKDKKYYEKPFNIDGVSKGSYKGMVQVDPYWITPELDGDAAANPASMHFYEPTYWRINGKLYHRSHLVISRYSDVADVLKPNYIYGGIPLVQMIYERCYAAERSANEAPQLLLTKRLYVLRTNTVKALGKFAEFMDRIGVFTDLKNNQGVQVIDKLEEFDQQDTTLTQVKEVIDGQYDIVSAISEVPVTKLMNRQITGLNSEGTGDRRNYEDVLEGEQEELDFVIERHHKLLIKSHIEPKRGEQPDISYNWNPVTSPTAKEIAEIKKIEMETDTGYIFAAILSPEEIRDKLLADQKSGYAVEEKNTGEDVDYTDYDDDENPSPESDRLFPETPNPTKSVI